MLTPGMVAFGVVVVVEVVVKVLALLLLRLLDSRHWQRPLSFTRCRAKSGLMCARHNFLGSSTVAVGTST